MLNYAGRLLNDVMTSGLLKTHELANQDLLIAKRRWNRVISAPV